MKASDHLKEAAGLVDGDRAQAYGDALQTHTNIATLWTATLTAAGMKPEKPLDAHVVAWMLSGLKQARSFAGPYRPDTYIDGAAYCAIAGDIAARSRSDAGD